MNPKQTVTLLGIGTAISLLGESTLYILLPIEKYALQLGITLTMVGILLGTNRAVRLLTNGPVGLLYERLPKRPLLTASLCLGALASVIYSYGYGFWAIFLGRVVWGLGWSLQWIGCRTMILKVSDDSNRATLNGLYQMFFLAGVGFASLFGSIIAEQLGFHIGQRLSAAVVFLMAAVWYMFLPDKGNEAKSTSHSKSFKQKKKLRWPIIVPSMITAFITRFVERGVLAATVVLWIKSLFGDETIVFGSLISVTTLSGAVNAVLALALIGASGDS